ncbi:MAG TPA: CRTAC1 family protein [Candidatus Polarisedimenticolia bacterium]|nr:CRTAC1 family protein [Candidatus Polarisedimenticolia bacterium]
MTRAPRKGLPTGACLGLLCALTLPAPWPSTVLADAAPPSVPAVPRRPDGPQARLHPGGTWRMTALLAEIARRADPFKNQFMNAERADLLRRAVAEASDPEQRGFLTFRLAEELVYAGRPQEAIAAVTPLLDPPAAMRHVVPPAHVIREFLAVCHLRIGEQENCILHHGIDSCLLPIKGSGIHTDQRGSRAAMAELAALLPLDQGNLDLRWLLNVAAMTVGDYPDKVPPAWVIPPKVFESEHDIGRFYDVAPAAGLAVRGRAGGGVMEDFDGDGLLDIMVSASGMRDQLRVFRNEGHGRFTERTTEAGLAGEIGGLNLASADFDNDGAVDVLVLRGAWLGAGGRIPNSLLRNHGDGTFEDVTERAGLLTFRPTQAGAWGDFDGDGLLDLFVGNESARQDPHPSELYRNNGDGTFTDVTSWLGRTDLGFVKGAAWGDFDNDGREDLYVSVGDGANLLFHNDGPKQGGGWAFTEMARRAGVAEPRHSFAVWWWDYDNDGWLDLWVSPYTIDGPGDTMAMYLGLPTKAEVPRLYRNNRDGTFTDVARAARLDRVALVMGANFGDLDNDGWLDCYLGTGNPRLEMLVPNRMFRNDGGSRFQDVTTSGGFGHLQKGHAVSFGDLDNDGDQDIHQQMGGAYVGDVSQNVLYENPGHGGRWITLELVGRRANRFGVGARVRVDVRTPAGARSIHVTGGTGGSFGASSLRQEIGLGDAVRIEQVEIVWPGSGLRQVARGLGLDAAWRIVEGTERAERIRYPRFDLSPG